MTELTEDQKRDLDTIAVEHRIRIESRAKLLEVSPEFVFDMLRSLHSHFKRLTELPEDLILISRTATYLPLENKFILMVGSMEFDSVPLGERLPRMVMTFERCDCTMTD